MRKSGWISFCGWAALGLVLFVVAASVLAGISHAAPIPAGVAALAMVLAVPSFGLWILGTVVHRFRVGGAQIRAQAMIEAQQRATQPGCGVCGKRRAVVLCTSHRVLLCAPCLDSHRQAACEFADVSVVVQSGAVAPSPRAITPAPQHRKEGAG